MGTLIDLTGQKFGKLTVLYRAPNMRKTKRTTLVVWHCKCDCGNECDVIGMYLKNGHVKSCGCLQKEKVIENNSKYKSKTNKYDLSGDFGVGYTFNIDPTDPLKKRNYFYFDLEDYEKIKKYCWGFNTYGYLIAHNKGSVEQNHIRLHNLIMENDPLYEIDHIKHKNYDNRKSELRICTHSENMKNYKKNNSTKNIYIRQLKDNKKRYYYFLQCDNEYVPGDTFDTFEEAVAARKEAEDKYFGEFSYDNSMKLKTS